MGFDLFDDEIDALDIMIFEDVSEDNDWRDEYMFNDYGLDPDDYDSLEEFLDAYNDARTQKLEDEEYDEEY